MEMQLSPDCMNPSLEVIKLEGWEGSRYRGKTLSLVWCEGIVHSHRFIFGAGIVAGVIATKLVRRFVPYDLREKNVFVTGGSRGLGLLLAHEFAARGSRVAISARDREELERAANQLRQVTSDVLAIEADMTMREEAETAVSKVRGQFGPVDVLVNNAGTISVGPMEAMTIDDYRTSINTHFWGPYFATTAVLPEMQKRNAGRIVNISSIGGKISVPHLLPYSVVAQQTGHTSTIFSYLVSKLSGRM